MSVNEGDFCKIDNEIKYSLIFNNIFLESDVGLLVIDSDFYLVTWNPWVTKYSNINLNDVVGQALLDIFPVLQKSSVERAFVSALNNGMSSVISHTLNRKPFPFVLNSGESLQQQITVKPIELESQEQRYCLIQITDVSAAVNREKQLIDQAKRTKAISNKLTQEKERAQVTLDSIADAVITTDEEGVVLSMNPVAEMLTGVVEEEVKNQKVESYFKLIHEKTRESIVCPVTQCLETRIIITNEHEHILLGRIGRFSITDSVAPILSEDGQLLGTILVFRDVTQSRALSAELNWQALHDPLTNLANRRQFELTMKALLTKSKADKLVHHLLYLDLDQFKIVNDTCGHDAGDQLLIQVSDTLEKKLRKSDLLARLGGDEFGVLLENCDQEHALLVANNLRQAVEDFRFGWQTQSFRIGVSIGISVITGEEAKASEILSAADAACYVAKEMGRNRVHFHQQNNSAASEHQEEMQWISRLQTALDKDSFVLFLQRITNTDSAENTAEHYEVLLRMVGENNEIIPPGAFLPAAERFNLIGSLDRWVVENVFKKINEIDKNDKEKAKIIFSINLSGVSMGDDGLLDRICYLLDHSDFSSKQICFEVTETAAISNLKKAMNFLTVLRNRGCKIALDDFGSGLSSFAYLKTLPVDYLKIDGYFVKDIAVDKIDKAFVESINQIGQVMGLETIAEFVENEDIFTILKDIGVNYAQGYGIHKPCPFDEVFSTTS